MAVIGGIGDVLALISLVREVAAALNGSRGSQAEYQEVRRELEGLENALLQYQLLFQARCDDPALNAIFKSTNSRAEDCQRCIEVFSRQTVKFERSLGVVGAGNMCRDTTMKIRWQLTKKEEVARFRAEIAQHVSSLNMLLGIANLGMQRYNQEKLKSRLETLEENSEERSKIQESSITRLRNVVESGTTQSETALSRIQKDLKLDWLRQLGMELKGMVLQIFTNSGTTLSALQRIEMQLQSRSDAALARTFTFEDALGRSTHIDMVYVSSWDAFDGMIEACFRSLPSHKKVARKNYVLHDQKTDRELQRSLPWSAAVLPGQNIIMTILIGQGSLSSLQSSCPACHANLNEFEKNRLSHTCRMCQYKVTISVIVLELAPKYNESSRQACPNTLARKEQDLRVFQKHLLRLLGYIYSDPVSDDEIYYFKRVVVFLASGFNAGTVGQLLSIVFSATRFDCDGSTAIPFSLDELLGRRSTNKNVKSIQVF